MFALKARLELNPASERCVWDEDASVVLDPARARAARVEIADWPGYEPTPLHSLDGLASRTRIGRLWYKDESHRFGIGSFKALGGAFGVFQALRRALGPDATAEALMRGPIRAKAARITMTCATAGNHGRSVAWGSELFGCRSVVFLPAGASEARARAIAGHGAEVVRTTEPYDDAVQRAQRTAEAEGWVVVSDTSYEGYTETPRDVMHGYTMIAEETLAVLPEPLTHLFVQAGVGGLSTGVCGHIWERLGPERPIFILVEPFSADCFFRSLSSGELTEVPGPFETMMGGLAAGVPSPLSWRLLSRCADFVVAIDDEASRRAIRRLAEPTGADPVLVAGESGAAGLGALLEVAESSELGQAMGLGPDSRVLVIGTEGAMDPVSWERIVGRPPRLP